MTRVLKLAESGVDAAADAVLEALAGPGAVVLLPTETVYGLVCRAVGYDKRQQFFRCYRGRCREILAGA